jgi:hypothetical protein
MQAGNPIMAKAEVRLSAQRIYQDLVEENGFIDSRSTQMLSYV